MRIVSFSLDLTIPFCMICQQMKHEDIDAIYMIHLDDLSTYGWIIHNLNLQFHDLPHTKYMHPKNVLLDNYAIGKV